MLQLIDQDDVVGLSTHKEIMKSYKFELKPTRKQEVILNKTIGICRHLYNLGLEQRKKSYEKGGWSINYGDQQNQLPELRQKCTEFNDIYAQILQNVLRRLDISMKNFFRRIKNNNVDSGKYEKPGFPRFKGYGRYDSFTFPQYGYGCNIVDKKGQKDDKGNIIKLSKIGNIKFIKHRDIEGIIKIVTIKKEIYKFFVIFVCQQYVEIPSPKQYIDVGDLNNHSIGIDMGLSNIVNLSNETKIESPKFLKKSLKKLRREQRRLSRKKRYDIIDPKTNKPKRDQANKKIKKNSNNREKQRIKVAKVHRKITNQRRNFNHEVSRTLVNNFDLIAFEDLSIQRMMQDRRYSRGIADSGWSQIQMFTRYKAEWAGKIVEFVDPKYTSQHCSRCGKLVGRLTEGETFVCPFCGLSINVHVNAGINIRNRSIEYQKLSRDAIARIHAFGDVTSTQIEISEQVTSLNKETSSNTKDGKLEGMIPQAPPFSELA